MGDGRREMGDEAVLVVKGEERQAVGYWAEGWMLDYGCWILECLSLGRIEL